MWIVCLSIFLFWRCKTISELKINEQIRDKEVRVIGTDGEQLGIMSSREAYKLAQEAELDLVKIAPTAKPPVCKIIDYGKYRYEMARKEKEAKKKQKTVELKEVRLSPNIDTNDLNTKINAAKKKSHFVSAEERWLMCRTADIFWMILQKSWKRLPQWKRHPNWKVGI